MVVALSALLALAYAGLVFTYRNSWRNLQEWKLPEDFEPQARVSVLIPARNEARNIEQCLHSILQGIFPQNLLEIIVIDDFSEDETAQLSESFQLSESSISCIRLSNLLPPEARFTANKKKALELGVAQAKGEIIITTDADCQAPKHWLPLMASTFENPAIQMVCAPVVFHEGKNLLQKFQSLDFLGMMGITGAGMRLGRHQMGNGANLAFRKKAFQAVGGYSGNEHLASGDDMFLVQKTAARWPGSVLFLKSREAVVLTEAAPDWKSFWQQRLRWGTKNAAIPSGMLRLSLLVVFLFCWSIWVNVGLAIAGIVPWQVFVFQVFAKMLADFLFLFEMCRFFGRGHWLRWFLPSFFLHTAYIPILGTASLFFKKYKWKGRQTR